MNELRLTWDIVLGLQGRLTVKENSSYKTASKKLGLQCLLWTTGRDGDA